MSQQFAPDAVASMLGPTPHVRVVAILCWQGNQLLVQQRRTTQPLPMLWEFPGGKVEPLEWESCALRRECEEELSVAVELGALAWRAEHHIGGKVVTLHFYHGRIVGDAAPSLQAAARMAWLTPAQMCDLAFCPADVALVAALARGELVNPWP